MSHFILHPSTETSFCQGVVWPLNDSKANSSLLVLGHFTLLKDVRPMLDKLFVPRVVFLFSCQGRNTISAVWSSLHNRVWCHNYTRFNTHLTEEMLVITTGQYKCICFLGEQGLKHHLCSTWVQVLGRAFDFIFVGHDLKKTIWQTFCGLFQSDVFLCRLGFPSVSSVIWARDQTGHTWFS